MSFSFPHEGVSLAGLKRLVDEKGDIKKFEGKSTYKVASELIKSKTKNQSYLDYLRNIAPEEVGKANLFISHALDSDFLGFLDAVSNFCSQRGMKDEETYLCLDILCFNLHDEDPTLNGLADAYKAMFKKVKRAIYIIDEYQNPKFFERFWCLYELLQGFKNKMR